MQTGTVSVGELLRVFLGTILTPVEMSRNHEKGSKVCIRVP